jgi:hypothetical protein
LKSFEQKYSSQPVQYIGPDLLHIEHFFDVAISIDMMKKNSIIENKLEDIMLFTL